jgi:hypothetical protein
MPESQGRRSQKTRRNREQPPPPPQQLSRRRIARFLWVGLLAVATLLGGAAAAVTFLPRMTVDPGGSVHPSSLVSPLPFTIANTGIIPLWYVQPMIGVCYILYGPHRDPPTRCDSNLKTQLSFSEWNIRSLTMDEKYTIRLGDFLGVNYFAGADISITIAYQPWFIPILREKEFRFVTRTEDDGTISWLSKPAQSR